LAGCEHVPEKACLELDRRWNPISRELQAGRMHHMASKLAGSIDPQEKIRRKSGENQGNITRNRGQTESTVRNKADPGLILRTAASD
jgi:hypothetical protein